MNSSPHSATADLRATLLTWGPIVAGLAFMYGPSFVDLFQGIWRTDEQAHGQRRNRIFAYAAPAS